MYLKSRLSPGADGGSANQARGTQSERQIREAAYFIWEKEGRASGRELDHWLRAEREVRHLVDAGKIRPQPW